MKFKKVFVLAMCLALLFSVCPTASAVEAETKTMSVHFINVGQGDSTLIQLPNGENMLIDAGTSSAGKTVTKYLKAQKIKKIDYLIATHPHDDHIGGLPAVIKDYEIGAIYAPRAVASTKSYENFLKAVQNKGLSINTAKAGTDIIKEKDLKISILAPAKSTYTDLNNYSIVLKITYGKTSFLFMGDAEQLIEKEIKANLVKANVIKIGHHGSTSSTSAAFLKSVSPQSAVISCGKKNSYGHPAQQTLDTLANAGAAIYRTDKVGNIVFTSDGTRLSVDKKPTAHTPSNAPTTQGGSQGSANNSGAGATNTQSSVVYVTKTGTKYHKNGCKYLEKSKIEISLEKAKKSYGPCSVCKPAA